MFDPSETAIFPLSLAVFEEYMLRDERPNHPMVFGMQLTFSGEMLRAEFEAALRATLPCHPLLYAQIKRTARGKSVWTLDGAIAPRIDWGVLGDPVGGPPGARIDLSCGPGLRLWIRQGSGKAEMTLHFHHASCDAVGALGFLGNLLAAYGARTSPQDRRPALPCCDPSSLLRRERFAAVASRSRPMDRARAICKGVRDGVRWFRRRPAILASRVSERARPGPGSVPLLNIDQHAFNREETARLRQVRARHGVTLNDLLLRDMFQTLREWLEENPSASATPWMRIAIPVNLRAGDDERRSAANGVSYTFLTRHQNECVDGQKLLEGIHGETDAATRWRRAMMFLRGFRLMDRIPGAVSLYMNANRCLATVVLSNLGEVTRHLGTEFPCESGKICVGNLILEDVVGVPPVRPNTGAAFMVGTYDERLWIGLRSDPLVLSPDDSRRLLALYIGRLRRTMDG